MELENKIQTQIIMSIEEHNNLMNEVNRLKQSVKKLEEQLNIKNDNIDIQISRITEDEIIELINNDKLTLEKVKLWVDLMIKGISGKTIIHSSSRMGQLDIVEYVLDKGVDIDSLDNIGETPLIYAVSKFGQIKVINYLLDRGANINHQDKYGWSALHYACEWNYLEIVKVLVDRGINIQLKTNNGTALDIAIRRKYQKIVDYLKSVIKERLKTDYERLKTDYENKLSELEN